MVLKKGISVITPVYKGQDYVKTFLDSFKNQTLDYNFFEIIFILNGELDETPNIIKKFQDENPKMNIILSDSEFGATKALNKGISLSNREYATLVDIDDYVSPNYLKKLLEYSKAGRIVIATFMDIDEIGNVTPSYLSEPLLNKSGIIDNAFEYMPGAISIMTAKSIPTINVKEILFNPNLKNGYDISYSSTLYAKNEFEFYLLNKNEDATYYRLVRENSISRKSLSYQFNVIDRLKVISDINKSLKLTTNQRKKNFIQSLTIGQVEKINQYLKVYPNEFKKVVEEINSYNFDYFPYKFFNEDFSNIKDSNELIISYAFPPTNTTTSNVVAKKILTEKKNVSVICANLNNLDKDYSLEKIVNQFVIDKITIDLPYEFSLDNAKKFAELGLIELNKRPVYDKIYSRANFIHSHLLGFYYKINNDTFWSAEFSDPLIYNINGNYHSAKISDEELVAEINNKIPEGFEKIKSTDTINYVIEYITYIFADEIIFTNENQKEIMINNFPKLKDFISKKSIISKHPTLNKKYYYIKNSEYPIDKNYINFAYFGVILGNRNFEKFINGFDNLNPKFKDKFRLHIFSPNKIMFEQILSSDILSKTIINPPLEFLDFLNLTTKFDILLVEDSMIDDLYSKNPFLPSKISDYKGSETDIWAVCDKGSIMDKMDIKYKSYLNDVKSSKTIINQIMEDKLNIKVEKDDDLNLNKYLKNRNVHLTKKIEELISVAEDEFKKDSAYESRIQNLEIENEKLKKELESGIFKKLLKKIKN